MKTENQIIFKRDGYQLKAEQHGEGPNLLIIGSVDYYKRVIPKALHDYFTCLYLDHRGFALTGKGNQIINLDIISDDIEAICESFNIQRASVLGHSGHAYMALHFASSSNIHIEKVMVVGASPSLSKEMKAKQFSHWESHASDERKRLFKQNIGKLEHDINKEPHKKFVHLCNRLSPMRWAVPNFNELPLWEQVHTNTALLDALWGDIFDNIDVTTLPKVNQLEVIVAIGTLDFSVAPLSTWLELWGAFKSLELIELEGVSHTPMLESPVSFVELMCHHLLD
ncbi:alpha/beta fold hydrolase [Vibrio splendidus]|uniref:alpha/beta fold hydrolase n=1 Tax=Vibrio splendidus TaxID=29497 RepID=UPI00076A5350|nr:alpha/beta hydrolase [Vibrio splendidus]PHX04208.1 Alpha/beta hydrolase family protein [Vibrio splendidus]